MQLDDSAAACMKCGETLLTDPEAEAAAEAEMLKCYGRILEPRERAALCDDCYAEFREWQAVTRPWHVRPPLLN